MSAIEIQAELQALRQNALVSLYVLDATKIGGAILRFYPGTDAMNVPVVWQGNTYLPMPVQAKSFEWNGSGSPPRPSLVFGNVGGMISGLVIAYDDLVGAQISRKRTYVKYLDAQPTADPTKYLPDDIYFIERKVSETRQQVEFELGTAMDVDDVQLPRRLVYANLCVSQYRGPECGFASDTVVADIDGNPAPTVLNNRGSYSPTATYAAGDYVHVSSPMTGVLRYFWCTGANTGDGTFSITPNPAFWVEDQCSKRVVDGCRPRFKHDPLGLPYGGFPGTERAQ